MGPSFRPSRHGDHKEGFSAESLRSLWRHCEEIRSWNELGIEWRDGVAVCIAGWQFEGGLRLKGDGSVVGECCGLRLLR